VPRSRNDGQVRSKLLEPGQLRRRELPQLPNDGRDDAAGLLVPHGKLLGLP